MVYSPLLSSTLLSRFHKFYLSMKDLENLAEFNLLQNLNLCTQKSVCPTSLGHFCGHSLALTSIGQSWFMVFVLLCPHRYHTEFLGADIFTLVFSRRINKQKLKVGALI